MKESGGRRRLYGKDIKVSCSKLDCLYSMDDLRQLVHLLIQDFFCQAPPALSQRHPQSLFPMILGRLLRFHIATFAQPHQTPSPETAISSVGKIQSHIPQIRPTIPDQPHLTRQPDTTRLVRTHNSAQRPQTLPQSGHQRSSGSAPFG